MSVNSSGSSMSYQIDPTWLHAITVIFGYSLTSEPAEELQGWCEHHHISTINDILFWPPEVFCYNSPETKFKSGKKVSPLNTKNVLCLDRLHKFINFLARHDADKLLEENWTNITQKEYQQCLMKIIPDPNPIITTSSSQVVNNPTTKSVENDLLYFKKGIKRDLSSYPVFKDEKHFDHYSRTLQIITKQHEVNEILNPNYRPGTTPAEIELFEAKNTFMFSVFNATLLTDKGKNIVRKHLSTMNAQAVWDELVQHMTNSTKGFTEKRRLTEYVCTVVLDDNFKGTTHNFILHFQEQFRKLDELTPDPKDQMSFDVRLTLLQKAVANIPELAIVSTLDEYNQVLHKSKGARISFDNYFDLL